MASRLGGDFDRFWLAAAVSNLGDGIRVTALPLLAYELTDDARLIGLVSAASLIPWLLFGAVGGALADRADRRRLMVGGQISRAALLCVLVAALTTDRASIWLVLVTAFVVGVGEILVDTSAQAAIPQLVATDQLERANGRMLSAMTVLDQVVGQAVGAALFALAPSTPFAVDAATFALGALVLSTVRRPLQGERSAARPTLRANIAEGFAFLRHHRLLRGLIAGISVNNFAGNLSFGVFVILVRGELGASPVTFGLVLSLGAVGGVLGSVAAAPLVARFGRRAVLSATPALFVAAYLVNAVATAPWMASVAFFVASFGVLVFNVPARSLRQEVTPEPLLGRVASSYRVVGFAAAALGAAMGGVLTEAVSIRFTNLSAAIVEVVAWVLLAATLARHIEAAAPMPEVRPER